jgi:hypothetical protein
MKHDKHELTYKKFLKAEKRLNEIWKQLWKPPKLKLKEPYQRGWILTIVLRDDYNKSKRDIVSSLLKKVTVSTIVRNPKHVSDIRKKPSLNSTRTYLGGNKTYWNSPYLASISQEKYDKLTPQEKKFFNLDSYESDKDRWGGKRNFYYLDIPSHYLVVKIEKRMITHSYELDTALLQEKDELQKILAPYWRTSGYYNWRDDFKITGERRKSKVETHKLLTNGDY